MTTEQTYTPDVEQIEADWKSYVTTADPDNYYDGLDEEEAQARWDRAIAQVRRDAAREALDGLARLAVQVEDGHGQLVPAERVRDHWAMVEIAARTYRDTHYPEETS